MQVETKGRNIQVRRVQAHHLAVRQSAGHVLDVVGAVGFRDPTEDSLAISLCARIEEVKPNLSESLFASGSLVRVLSVRGAVRVVPKRSLAVFTRALVPRDEEELSHLIRGARSLLVPLGTGAWEIFEIALRVIPSVLATSSLSKDELGKALTREALSHLTPSRREVWQWPSPLAEGQTLGETLMRHLISVISCSVPLVLVAVPGRRGRCFTAAPCHFSDEMEDHTAEIGLVRRYIHAYGPTDCESFAHWAGVSDSHARRLWGLCPDDLAEVSWDGNAGWMLAEDVLSLSTAPEPEGLRLLGSYDPFLQVPQRNLLVQGKSLHRYFYRSAGNPGMILHDGSCVAGWRPRQNKGRLSIVIEDIGEPLDRIAEDELNAELVRLAGSLGLRAEGCIVHRI